MLNWLTDIVENVYLLKKTGPKSGNSNGRHNDIVCCVY